jgi:hypothetical protein
MFSSPNCETQERRNPMSQQVADVLFERLISWGVDTILEFPAMEWMVCLRR